MEDDSEYEIATHRRVDLAALDDATIERAVQATLSLHGCRGAQISIALVDDAEIARLNETYLQHEGPTDVLSFDLNGDIEAGRVDGEIVASAETAQRVAGERGGNPAMELLLYLVHGTLHLLGYDDATVDAATAMHAKEDEVFKALGYEPIWNGQRLS